MTGPTATAALMVLPALVLVSPDPVDYPVLGAMLALMVGAVFLVARVLRLGWISDYFSAAVLLGFLTGERHRDATVVPGVVVYRLDDRLFFANAGYFQSRVREAVAGSPYDVAALVFDAEAVTSLDTSGARTIREVVEQLRTQDIVFVVARCRALFDEQIGPLGLDDVLPVTSRFRTVREAVQSVTGVDLDSPQPSNDQA